MNTKKTFGISPMIAGAALCVLSTGALPAMGSVTVSDTLYPIDTGPPTGDVLPLGNTQNSAPGFGNSSWETNYGTGGGKTELYLNPSGLGLGPNLGFSNVTLGDSGNNLVSLSYYTKKLNSDSGDWYINLYTAPTSNTGWYNDRITLEPGSYSGTSPTGWEQATTGSGSDQLMVTAIQAYGASALGSISPESLATLESSGTYSTATIKYIVLTVASNQEPPELQPGLNSLVDGLQFSTGDGSSATFNLEAAAPVPASFGLVGIGSLALLGGLALRRRMAKLQ